MSVLEKVSWPLPQKGIVVAGFHRSLVPSTKLPS